MKLSHDGREVDATFKVEGDTSAWSLVLESRSGARGPTAGVNTEYHVGLELILERLQAMRASVQSIEVDSKRTETRGLSASERRVKVPTGYPIRLEKVPSIHDLRVAISRGQGQVGRDAGAKGYGNGTKRIRLRFQLPLSDSSSKAELEIKIAQGGTRRPPSTETDRSPDAASEAGLAVEAAIVRNSPSRGQSYARTKALRLAVERHAVDVAMEHYRKTWSKVVHVGETESWDLECSQRGRHTLRVEVKGTVSVGETVFLTRNEVANARDNHPNVDLAIVSRIAVTWVDEKPVASGGDLKIHTEWRPNPESLEALVFEYRPPSGD